MIMRINQVLIFQIDTFVGYIFVTALKISITMVPTVYHWYL